MSSGLSILARFALGLALGCTVASTVGCAPELGPCDDSAARRVVYDQSGSPAFEGQALVISSCGAGAFCHASSATAEARRGVPTGLDYDVRIVEGDGEASIERLGRDQERVFAHRYDVWGQVASGRMPVSGEAGAEVADAAPVYSRVDALTGAAEPMPTLQTEEGRQILRNWLSCRAPVVARAEPGPGQDLGAVVSRREVAPLEPHWPDIYRRMIEPRCAVSACHGRSMAGELDLRGETEALNALCGAPSDGPECGSSGLSLIEPGDPDASLLVHKLAGRDAHGQAVCGDVMPTTGARIDERSIANIRQWITELTCP